MKHVQVRITLCYLSTSFSLVAALAFWSSSLLICAAVFFVGGMLMEVLRELHKL